jgi:hypothetical protein
MKMLNIKNLENKIKLYLIKRKLKNEMRKLYLHANFKEYYTVKGQKFILEDPFGEENWD